MGEENLLLLAHLSQLLDQMVKVFGEGGDTYHCSDIQVVKAEINYTSLWGSNWRTLATPRYYKECVEDAGKTDIGITALSPIIGPGTLLPPLRRLKDFVSHLHWTQGPQNVLELSQQGAGSLPEVYSSTNSRSNDKVRVGIACYVADQHGFGVTGSKPLLGMDLPGYLLTRQVSEQAQEHCVFKHDLNRNDCTRISRLEKNNSGAFDRVATITVSPRDKETMNSIISYSDGTILPLYEHGFDKIDLLSFRTVSHIVIEDQPRPYQHGPRLSDIICKRTIS
ncbi:hypothetical protein BJ138DRAFT_1106870 [Hygrophoropsis aurantiaca]|uniref:Uncharacterized protein n=1 Tax=Hygrophoropsis aurantiaca TaxID=72124 RepID=A0ACB7ZUJ4_9AGAM|nr:hypothetical protein BJ138DRAFT_1106870 [Hygrophoropsis aurantiaca]